MVCRPGGANQLVVFRRLFSRGAGFEAHNLQEVGMATSVIMKPTMGAFPLVRFLFSKINRSYSQIHSAFSSKFIRNYVSTNPNFRMWKTVSFTSYIVLHYLHIREELLKRRK